MGVLAAIGPGTATAVGMLVVSAGRITAVVHGGTSTIQGHPIQAPRKRSTYRVPDALDLYVHVGVTRAGTILKASLPNETCLVGRYLIISEERLSEGGISVTPSAKVSHDRN